ncbi:hypothetical protein [Homoserinibacter sp. GY 40078]|uniref:hypothetical protein n=1 Tax=Homoserinibacter sp. GY 40078 TaxID=2603275 RepID=UPI0011C7728B|nr:hypothetical protein [Homoserinibacter sp. GY 40078]TXK17069.1 hypothetical protein FVQ89_09320 [Homoserinibacter sp. GY 40078]
MATRRIHAAGMAVALAGAAALVVVPALGAAAPASADVQPIALSADGSTFVDDLGTALFGGAKIVPGASVTRTFWVKNRTAEPGHLAVAVQGVGSADPELLARLTVSADADGTPGSDVALADVDPCATLVSGVTLAGSGAMQVDVVLALGDLAGLDAQGSLGTFDLRVTLTSTDVDAPDGCATVDPPTDGGSGSGGSGSGGSGSTGTAGSGGSSVVVTGAGGGSAPADTDTAEEPVASGEDGSLQGEPAGASFTPWNTDRFYQEYIVALWLVGMIVGAIYALARRRRRRSTEEDA